MSPQDLSPLTVQENRAIKSLAQGKANEGQQTLALKAILQKIARTSALPFIEGSPDGTAFLLGRAFVGSEIYRAINMKLNEDSE